MMKHYNIPIFLPELACPYRCVYCNQFSITGNDDIVKPEDVKNIIDSHLASFKEENRFVEVAFFGGNFTGLPVKMQNDYLEVLLLPLLKNSSLSFIITHDLISETLILTHPHNLMTDRKSVV